MLLVGGMLVGTGAFTANSTYAAEADKTQTAPSNQTVEQIKTFNLVKKRWILCLR